MNFIWNYDFADSANCQLSWQLIDRIISGFCLKSNIFVAELSFVTKSRFFDKDEVCNFRHMCWVSPSFHLNWIDSIKLKKLINSPWNHLLIKSVNIKCRIVLHIRYLSRFFDRWAHQTTYAYIGNKYFFTKSCHRQTYQNSKISWQKMDMILVNKVL